MPTTKQTLRLVRVVNCVGGPIHDSKVVVCELCKEDCFCSGPALKLTLDDYRLLCDVCAPADPVGRIGRG